MKQVNLSRTAPRKRRSGYVIIQMIAFTLLSLMIAVIAVDVGFYLTMHNLLQSAADAGALAATQELFTNTSEDPGERQASARLQAASLVATYGNAANAVQIDSAQDVIFGYVDPTTGIYNPDTFTTPTSDSNYAPTGGYNAVLVHVRKTEGSPAGTMGTLLGNLLGISTMSTSAASVAMMDPSISQVISGLRPFYGCLGQYELAASDGDPTNNVARIFGPTQTLDGQTVPGCENLPNGNWGFADFDDADAGSPGMNTIADWLLNGYDGTVNTGGEYQTSSQSGAAIANNNVKQALDYLIDNQIPIMIALVDEIVGSGSNTRVRVGGYAGFVITSYKATGPENQRYVQGYFTTTICTQNCITQSTEHFSPGTQKLRLVGM